MQAPISLGLLPLLLMIALPAAAGPGGPSPYRLEVDAAEYRLRLPGEAPRGAQGRAGSSALGEMIERHARARGLDPALVHAVVRAESAYRAQAVSPKGAVGLMQVMPETGRRFGARDLADPENNLKAGTAYLGHLLDLFNRDLALALAAYNAGEGAVQRHGGRIPPYPETRAYVRGILRDYAPGRTPSPRSYIPGTRLDAGGLSPYRLSRDPWR